MGKLRTLLPTISLLEPRILFDGAAVATAVDVLDNNSFVAEQEITPPASSNNTTKEIAFVDSNIDGYENIINDLDASIEVYIIDKDSNGLEQISSFLAGKNDIDTLHIISHGNVGELSLGSTLLDSQTLSFSSSLLESIGNSLSENGDILLYGCSVGANGQGQDFVDAIAQLTSADVAASDDTTGSQSIGGDWNLEYSSGSIESQTIHSDSFSGELASQSVSGLNDISIADDSTDIKINPNIIISDGGNYGDGYIDFTVSSGLESGDNFVLKSTTGNANDDGEISISGSNVYLGRGGSTTLIGTVDNVKNGLNGQALRINFINITIEDLSVVTNGDFSQALSTGWTEVLDRVDLGAALPGTTIATPTDAQVTYPTANVAQNDDGSASGYSSPEVKIESGRLKLTESSVSIDNFGVVHGPSAYSDTFTGTTGMVLKFDWEANKIADDFHVVGYLVDATNKITIVLDKTGTTGSGTATAIIPSNGTYRFVFVSGTFDKTGGKAAGASMFIDNIRVEKPLVVDAVLQKLASQVEYTNANASVDKIVTVSTKNVIATLASSNLNLILIPVVEVASQESTFQPPPPVVNIIAPRSSNVGEPSFTPEPADTYKK